MPTRSRKLCSATGCSQLTSERWCEEHKSKPLVSRSYDTHRGSSSKRGYDAAWKKIRVLALMRDNYLCQHCLKKDDLIQATDVDHIIPISEDPEKRLELDNLQSLCKYHHDLKTYLHDGGLGHK